MVEGAEACLNKVGVVTSCRTPRVSSSEQRLGFRMRGSTGAAFPLATFAQMMATSILACHCPSGCGNSAKSRSKPRLRSFFTFLAPTKNTRKIKNPAFTAGKLETEIKMQRSTPTTGWQSCELPSCIPAFQAWARSNQSSSSLASILKSQY